MLHQGGVVDRANAVADSLGSDFERGPDGFGSHALAGMRKNGEALTLHLGEDGREVLGRAAGLIASDAEADHVMLLVLDGDGGYAFHMVIAELADCIEDPADTHFRFGGGFALGLEDTLHILLLPEHHAHGEVDL